MRPPSSQQGRWPCCAGSYGRSEEHTSELQSRLHLVCRLLLEKKTERVRRRFPRLLDDSDGAIALEAHTHDQNDPELPALPLGRPPRLVTAVGAIHHTRRQPDR